MTNDEMKLRDAILKIDAHVYHNGLCDLTKMIYELVASEREKAWNEAIEKASNIPHQGSALQGFYSLGPKSISEAIMALKTREGEGK